MKRGGLLRMAAFLREARRKGYAGGGKYETLCDDCKVFTYDRGLFSYRDKYCRLFLSGVCSGGELLSLSISGEANSGGAFEWQMTYSWLINSKFLGNDALMKEVWGFHRECLMIELEDGENKDPEMDFWPRGPIGRKKPDPILFDGRPVHLTYRYFPKGGGGSSFVSFDGLEEIGIYDEEQNKEEKVVRGSCMGGLQ